MYLENITGPKDIKKLNTSQLKVLADETRKVLINKISKTGGHHGPNLGVVELTVALHYVFDSPKDKIVFDVSHQCYAHKILTGRKMAYLDEEHFHEVSGYTNPLESEHDIFTIGHTSTSISLSLGLAKGRDLNNRNENIIAVIGDGSLTGGEALEGLNYAGEYNKNLIIILNDNEQSIAENHGGVYKHLKNLRDTNGQTANNVFENFGLEYKYLDDGHDIEKLVNILESVKDIDHPIVVHIHTIKGKGLPYAEKNREEWHAKGPFNVEDGSPRSTVNGVAKVVADSLIDLLDNNDKAVVINSATPARLGMVLGVRDKYVERGQFIDVGIAEENAMTMAAGVAKNGGTVVYGTYAPFLQRTYDQMSHDVCLNDCPATILVVSPGVRGAVSNTHIALCDIQEFCHIPNLIYLAPSSTEEYRKMFEFSTNQKKHPVAIRLASDIKESGVVDTTDYSIYNKNKVVKKGEKVALFAVGTLISMACEVANKVKDEMGLDITVINPLFLTGLDEKLLNHLNKNHGLIITIEDGELFGGYGQNIASFYGDSGMKVKNYGLSKAFHTDIVADKLLEENGISVDKLVGVIKEYI